MYIFMSTLPPHTHRVKQAKLAVWIFRTLRSVDTVHQRRSSVGLHNIVSALWITWYGKEGGRKQIWENIKWEDLDFSLFSFFSFFPLPSTVFAIQKTLLAAMMTIVYVWKHMYIRVHVCSIQNGIHPPPPSSFFSYFIPLFLPRFNMQYCCCCFFLFPGQCFRDAYQNLKGRHKKGSRRFFLLLFLKTNVAWCPVPPSPLSW